MLVMLMLAVYLPVWLESSLLKLRSEVSEETTRLCERSSMLLMW